MPIIQRAVLIALLASCGHAAGQTQRWTEERANAWYARQPWLVGANYIPATAINELEMWQADTFDPARIDKELGWAQSIGMNTMRVFLHDALWSQDAEGFKTRISRFLAIAQKHRIKPMLVLFDSCWDPFPKLGPQRAPAPGRHNSGWVQSPGARGLEDPAERIRLEAYVKGVVGAFGQDSRVLAWDIWNEPDNLNGSAYGAVELKDKVERVLALLPKAFEWARAGNPTQPLTSGLWQGDWTDDSKLSPTAAIQAAYSDVISFHDYNNPTAFEKRIQSLQRYRRPLLCTEYMARGNGSFFEGTLPVAKKYNVAAFNWGLVQGKTQTNLPWDSWQNAYVDREPAIWFHEVFFTDGKPYQPEEAAFIRRITREPRAKGMGSTK